MKFLLNFRMLLYLSDDKYYYYCYMESKWHHSQGTTRVQLLIGHSKLILLSQWAELLPIWTMPRRIVFAIMKDAIVWLVMIACGATTPLSYIYHWASCFVVSRKYHSVHVYIIHLCRWLITWYMHRPFWLVSFLKRTSENGSHCIFIHYQNCT
jgi:hypothetical protein